MKLALQMVSGYGGEFKTWRMPGAVADATDRFSIVPDSSHDGVKDFVEQVVPILQERGLFHTEYEGETLRENLGVSYEYGLNH
ncbi:hypothetical protein [Macrococcus epidermidis]|uniref:hypothetical protein n=1 Tax=Macrococcus epidermidis TaxID=1902580 RepID=UPI0027E1F6F2|nr:hypothetical protein [Macrococcus epidermidis]